MEKNLKSIKGKKPYQKPLIEQIELKPEEAVLTACKAVNNNPGPGTVCKSGGPACQRLGS